MILFRGIRDKHGAHVWRLDGGRREVLRRRRDLKDYTMADGLDWGTVNDGSALLALSLLGECLSNDLRALSLHVHFQWQVVAKLKHDEWALTPDDIIKAVHAIEVAMKRPNSVKGR